MLRGRREEFNSGGVDDQRILGDDHFAKSILNAQARSAKRITLDELIAIVCHEYQLAESELISQGRVRQASKARSVIGWLAQKSGG